MATDQPKFWIFAGVNGAGKSTLAQKPEVISLIGVKQHFNPDELAKKLRTSNQSLSIMEADLQALQLIEANVDRNIAIGNSFIVETVLSTDKYLGRVEAAKQAGFYVGMVYVALPSVELALRRIEQRVAAGGHAVQEERVRARWVRSHQMLARFIPKLDSIFVFSNADVPTLVAKGSGTKVEILKPGFLPDIDQALQTIMP